MDYTVHGILQARILEWAAFPFSRGSFQPRDRTPISCIGKRDSLAAEPQEKPKNTGMGSLSFLQWIFPTQESNQGLRHCRRILYQLSIREAPGLSCYQLKMDDFSCKMFYGSLGVTTKAKTYSSFTHTQKMESLYTTLENHLFIKVGREEKGNSGATKKLPGNN